MRYFHLLNLVNLSYFWKNFVKVQYASLLLVAPTISFSCLIFLTTILTIVVNDVIVIVTIIVIIIANTVLIVIVIFIY